MSRPFAANLTPHGSLRADRDLPNRQNSASLRKTPLWQKRIETAVYVCGVNFACISPVLARSPVNFAGSDKVATFDFRSIGMIAPSSDPGVKSISNECQGWGRASQDRSGLGIAAVAVWRLKRMIAPTAPVGNTSFLRREVR